jgi:hypothetical protein
MTKFAKVFTVNILMSSFEVPGASIIVCTLARVENVQFLRNRKGLALGMFIDVF